MVMYILIIKIPWRVSDHETGLSGWKCTFFPISYIYIYIKFTNMTIFLMKNYFNNCQKHSPLSRLLHCCPHMQGRERFSSWCYSWQHWPFKEKLNKLQKNRINSSIDSWTIVHYYSSKKIVKEFEKNYIHWYLQN